MLHICLKQWIYCKYFGQYWQILATQTIERRQLNALVLFFDEGERHKKKFT